MLDYDMMCCDDKFGDRAIIYTYVHDTLNQHSWLDHFIVSRQLYSCINNCRIIDVGSNLSDHLPISCTIDLPLSGSNNSSTVTPNVDNKRSYHLRWDKGDLMMYYYQTGFLLQSIVTPVALLHCRAGCNCDSHKTYY